MTAAQQKEVIMNDVIAAWESIIGSKNVVTDKSILSYYENTTYPTDNSVIAILKPKNREEVQQCVIAANKYKTPLYPISKGYNWGYGSRAPSCDKCAIIDLGRMNNITECDEKMGYMTVEPGVTFQQAYDYIAERNLNLIAPSIGSTRDASLIGNALERGVGKGPYGDRFQHACNMEVVLPSGEIINTGFGNVDNAHSKNLFRWGVGPSIDGLFSQSNFGIVTRMTFWLTQKPAYFQTIFYSVKDNDQMEKVIDAMRQLTLEGTLVPTSTFSNSYRIFAAHRQFPYSEVKDENKLIPNEYINQLEKKMLRGAYWGVEDAIMAPSKAIGKARAKRIKQVLGKIVDDIIFVDTTRAKLLELFWRPIKFFTGVDVRPTLFFFWNSLYLGKPMEKQLGICYWRKKTPVPKTFDIDRDKCGVISLTPSVPYEGKHVRKMMDIMEEVMRKYNLEPNLGLKTMSDRHLIGVPQILYDREIPGQDENAMKCYSEMLEKLTEAGYPPYRQGVQTMDKMTSTSPQYIEFINKLKAGIDPNNIISPGHYGIGN